MRCKATVLGEVDKVAMTKTALAVMFLAAACTKPADRCSSNLDCTDPAYPFCDVTGQFPASGGDMNVCTIPPPAPDAGAAAPADAPSTPVPGGCSPGAATCTNGELTVCNSDGMTATMTACPVGCEASGTACKTIVPSNGLGPALASAVSEADVMFPATVTINTDTGVVVDGAQVPINVPTVVVTQSGAPSIRVYIAHSFDITNAGVVGSAALAFVAATTINIHGLVSESASGTTSASGALLTGTCAGAASSKGGGGGGNGTAGGAGAAPLGGTAASGGSAQSLFSPLAGGCVGGTDGTNPVGGGGGGALQLVAGTAITVTATGTLSLGGGGAGAQGGGGAGGTLVAESPVVTIDGTVAANGGSGGACGVNGNNATPDTTPAPSVSGCVHMVSTHTLPGFSGSGGTAAQAPGGGSNGTEAGPGGGGAVGRLAVTTFDGMLQHANSAILSVAMTTGTIAVK